MAALAEGLSLNPKMKESEGFTFKLWNYLPLPLTLRLETPLTDEQLMQFSGAYQPYRMERNANGELEIMSPTGWDGSDREDFAARMLPNWADDHGGRSKGPTAGFILKDGSVRSPDACWVSNARVADLTEAEKKGSLHFAPNF